MDKINSFTDGLNKYKDNSNEQKAFIQGHKEANEFLLAYIDEYGHDGDIETMEHLTRKIDHFVEEVREHHPEMVDKFLMKVDYIVNPDFSKETALYAVSKMKNKDGSVGEHWNYETTTKVLEAKGYNFKPCDWYYVLNMMYSDYYKSGRADDVYVEIAYDFLNDVDGPKHKAKKWATMQ